MGNGRHAAVALLLLFWPAVVVSEPLGKSILPAYRTTMKVSVCGCGFAQYFSTWEPGFNDPARLETAVKNVLDVWNTQSEVDLKFAWAGFYDDYASDGPTPGRCNDVPAYCQTMGDPPPQVGFQYVRAFQAGPTAANNSCWESCPQPTQCGYDECHTNFFANTNGGVPYRIAFSYTGPQVGDKSFQQIFFHELSHSIGWTRNAPNIEPFSIANCGISRFPWDEDCVQLRQNPGANYVPYAAQSRSIRHIYSTNGGANWYYGTDANIGTERTNDPVGVAYRPAVTGNGEYLLAWFEAGSQKRLVTVKGSASTNGTVTWSTSSKRTHTSATASGWFSPSVTYGNGYWVVAWAARGINNDSNSIDGNPIYFIYSSDGQTWSAPQLLSWTCSGCTTFDYGSLGSPVVRYNAQRNRFSVLWVDYRSASLAPYPYKEIGGIRHCALQRYVLLGVNYFRVTNCNKLDYYEGTELLDLMSWNTPGFACDQDGSCIITGANVDASADNGFWNVLAYMGPTDNLWFIPTPPLVQSGNWTSRSEISMTEVDPVFRTVW